MWWRSAVNFSFFLSLATFRMRSSACDTLTRLCARHVLCWPAFPLVSALRSTGSAAVGSAADRSAAGCSTLFAGFPATMTESDFSCPCIIGYGSSPSRCGPPYSAHIPRRRRPDTRAPRFRRDPFARDVALDPGGTTMPRIPALLMLRSTMKTVSAPASRSFRGSLPHPTHPLCTLRVRRLRRLTQHSLPGGLLGLTWSGLAPADRASFAWRLPSFDHLVGQGEQGRRHRQPERLRGLQVDGKLEFGRALYWQLA